MVWNEIHRTGTQDQVIAIHNLLCQNSSLRFNAGTHAVFPSCLILSKRLRKTGVAT